LSLKALKYSEVADPCIPWYRNCPLPLETNCPYDMKMASPPPCTSTRPLLSCEMLFIADSRREIYCCIPGKRYPQCMEVLFFEQQWHMEKILPIYFICPLFNIKMSS
jgi:hypothetical protein